ncbi:hypothetical protein [Brevundimonas sp. SORGH_AS_0993]|uniref:hypothetical protein n=1 Tax=Brevundimonas sp. SORGH_AS_0993 TaxID=3041794 RepID=UPI002787D2FD|nr:hypothetical protein [Brevundimonas sp. SORGH_AS_0993]MDQ1153983.1 CBS domain containing-hemolysin-like protein [Brevundimonas sp. SORGH_AS_0993]
MLESWLRAANPFNRPRAMAEAQRSAQTASFGLIASAATSLATAGLMALHPEWIGTIMANQYARMGMSGEMQQTQQAMMATIMPWAMVGGSVVTVAICLVLAWVQWKFMTRAIPIILLILIGYSAVTGVVGLSTGQYHGVASGFVTMTALSWAVQLVCGVLYAAAFRGALVLHRLKQEP